MDLTGRKRYRVSPSEQYSLAVTVMTVDGESFAGELLDLSIEGAGTRFKRDFGPTLAIGQPATLTFTSARLHKPIQVAARVRSRVELGSFRSYRYGFEFDQWEELERRLSGEIHQLFNQRMLYRAEPDPTEPIEMLVRLVETSTFPDFQARGTAKDISATGAALLMDRNAETTLAATDLVEVSFQLPTTSALLHLIAWIRHRELQGDHVCYGLEFDAQRSQGLEQQQNEIIKYARRRQLATPPRRLR